MLIPGAQTPFMTFHLLCLHMLSIFPTLTAHPLLPPFIHERAGRDENEGRRRDQEGTSATGTWSLLPHRWGPRGPRGQLQLMAIPEEDHRFPSIEGSRTFSLSLPHLPLTPPGGIEFSQDLYPPLCHTASTLSPECHRSDLLLQKLLITTAPEGQL